MNNIKKDSFRNTTKNNIRLLFLQNNHYKSHKGINSKKIIERNAPLDSYFTTTNKNTISTSNSNSNILNQDFLIKKLNNLRKVNRELNTQLKNI